MRLTNYIVSESIEYDIPFFDVDTMDITWHGHYIKYFEIARCALLDKLQYNYIDMKLSGYAWPIVDLRIKFIKPSLFKQRIVISAYLVEYECRLKIHYIIKDKLTDKKLTEGYTVQVAVDTQTNTLCFSTPAIFTDKIRAYL